MLRTVDVQLAYDSYSTSIDDAWCRYAGALRSLFWPAICMPTLYGQVPSAVKRSTGTCLIWQEDDMFHSHRAAKEGLPRLRKFLA